LGENSEICQENKDIHCIITGNLNICTKEDSMNQSQYSAEDWENCLFIVGLMHGPITKMITLKVILGMSSYGMGSDLIMLSPELGKKIRTGFHIRI
jgi:hypothetical protein